VHGIQKEEEEEEEEEEERKKEGILNSSCKAGKEVCLVGLMQRIRRAET
jgi:hypothetical protein